MKRKWIMVAAAVVVMACLYFFVKPKHGENEAQVREVAEQKMEDLNADSVEAAMNLVKGTARSMGIRVE